MHRCEQLLHSLLEGSSGCVKSENTS